MFFKLEWVDCIITEAAFSTRIIYARYLIFSFNDKLYVTVCLRILDHFIW